MVQLGEGIGKVLSVDKLVGGILETVLPAVRRAWGRRDEEELASIGKGEMLVAGVEGSRLTEVDLELLTQEFLTVPDLADVDGGLLVEEGDDDATEGLERSKGVEGCGLRDQIANSLQVLGQEDVHVIEVGEDEGVGGRRRNGQGW